MAEHPVSSSSLPPSGSSFPDASFETPQSTRSIEFSQPILPSIQPLSTRSPLDEPIEGAKTRTKEINQAKHETFNGCVIVGD